jgi:hypothetical protein
MIGGAAPSWQTGSFAGPVRGLRMPGMLIDPIVEYARWLHEGQVAVSEFLDLVEQERDLSMPRGQS